MSRQRFGVGATWRVRSWRLEVRPTAAGDSAEPDDPVRSYAVGVGAELEAPSDPRPRLPSYVPPRYPVRVEGRVVSEGGGDDDRTWMTVIDERDSQARYRIDIPLWNQRVPALFLPGNVPGHLFFPAFKGQRVLVALDLHEARVERFLDWAPGARLPASTQGNHLLLGLQPSNGTSIAHTFADGLPVLTVRRTFGRDLQTLLVEEGRVFLEVKEDPSLAVVEPRHDVSVVVAAAREQVGAAVRGAVAAVTGSFEETLGTTSARLDGALDEAGAEVTAAEGQLLGQMAAVEATLAELEGSLGASLAEVSAAVASARAALASALAGA